MKKLIIFGTGKIGQVLSYYLENEYEIGAFTADEQFVKTDMIRSIPVLSFTDVTEKIDPAHYLMLVAVGYVEMNSVRQRIIEEVQNFGFQLINYVHPSVNLTGVELKGVNNVFLENVSMQPMCSIGSGNFFWSNCVIAHGTTIGNNNWITSGSTIAGDCNVGSCNFLGINSAISNNISLGDSVFIGANTLVNKDLDSDKTIISEAGMSIGLDSHRFMKFAKM